MTPNSEPKAPGLTDAQIAILDRLTVIQAEQDCMIRETKRSIKDLKKKKNPKTAA